MQTPPGDENNTPSRSLPPHGERAGWGTAPQPQAPTWPYAPNTAAPPAARPAYAPIPTEPDAPPPQIGPEHVPWKWYDCLVPALPIILALVVAVIGVATGTTDRATAADNATNPTLSDRTLVANMVAGVAIYAFMLAMVWLLALRKYHVGWSALGLRAAPRVFWALLLPLLAVMYIASGLIGQVVNALFYGGKGENPQLDTLTGGRGFSWVALGTAIVTASIAAPIVEELFFRGMLYGWLRTRWGATGSVMTSGLLFAVPHIYPIILASIFVVGVTLALVYERTKSTIATIALHSAFNTAGVVIVFVELLRQ